MLTRNLTSISILIPRKILRQFVFLPGQMRLKATIKIRVGLQALNVCAI